MNWSENFREGLARENRENKTLAKITAYTVYYTDIEISRSVDCQESYIFPKGFVPRENITLGTTDTWYFIRPGRYLLY